MFKATVVANFDNMASFHVHDFGRHFFRDIDFMGDNHLGNACLLQLLNNGDDLRSNFRIQRGRRFIK